MQACNSMSYGLLNEIKAAIGKEIVVECLAILFICADVLAGKDKVTYVKMTPEKAQEVIEKHLKGGQVVSEYTIGAVTA